MSKVSSLCLLMLCGLAGCQTAPTAPAQDFVAAANALTQAEAAYFDQIQAASDDSHVLIASAIYVRHIGSFARISAELTKRDDFAKAKAARMAIMDQLQNYAQQIAAISTAATDTAIPTQAKTTAASVTTLLTDLNAARLTQPQAALIQTAVNTLAAAIINAAAAHDLQRLAKQASQPIGDIATMVAQDTANIETDNFAPGLLVDQQTAMMSILARIYQDPTADSSQRLAAIIAWRSWKPSLVTAGKDIDDALARLTKANDALAAGQPVSASLLAQQAFALAQQAQNLPPNTK